MRRRDLILGLSGALAAPLAARAQQKAMPVIGFLGASTPSGTVQWVSAFQGRLKELGWIDGKDVVVEHRWAEGRSDRMAQIAAEFVRLGVAVIVTYGTAAVAAAKSATTGIPIVFAAAGDPVGTGLVASLARPGGNVTGLSMEQTDTGAKRLQLLSEVVPRLRRLGIIANINSAAAAAELDKVAGTAAVINAVAVRAALRRPEEIAPAIEAMGQIDGLYVVTDPLMFSNWTRINTFVLAKRIPTICLYRAYVAAGCLMSYGPNYPVLFRRAAEMVDKILRGTKPADIPVEQPTQFDLILNQTTANALGLTIPQSILARADEVIE